MPTNRELIKENRELRQQVEDLLDRLDQAVNVLAPSVDDEDDDDFPDDDE